MSDDKPNPFGAVLRKTGNRPEEPASSPTGTKAPSKAPVASASTDKPNPFGATLRSAAAAKFENNTASNNNNNSTLKKPDSTSSTTDKPNPFGSVLKSSSSSVPTPAKTPAGSTNNSTSDSTSPFGATLKKTTSGAIPAKAEDSKNKPVAPSGDKPNPFGAVLKSTTTTTTTPSTNNATATTVKKDDVKNNVASKPTTPKDAGLNPKTPVASPTTTITTAAVESPSTEPPASEKQKTADEAPKSAPTTTTQDEKTSSVVTQNNNNTNSNLPEGWSEKKDPSTGKTYYYNKSTKETSWKRPEGEAAAATVVVALAGTENNNNNNNSDETSALPEGWKEKKDPSTGKTFYFNKSTGETSWKKPTAAISTKPVAESSLSGAENKNVPSAAEGDTQQQLELPEGWKEKKDPTTGKIFYYNKSTGETSWKKPAAPAGATSTTQPSEENNNNNESSPLPEGWKEKADPSSGKPFYYNKSTGETSWKRPKGAESNNNNNHSNDDKKQEESSPSVTEGPLPEGWKEKTDPASGKPFYYNKSTGETSWKRPGGPSTSNASASAAKNTVQRTPEEIAAAWVNLEDERTGRKYWANKLTNEVSWLSPLETNADANAAKEIREQGWAEAEDTLGQRYYYNQKTKEVSWTWPPSNIEGSALDSSPSNLNANNLNNLLLSAAALSSKGSKPNSNMPSSRKDAGRRQSVAAFGTESGGRRPSVTAFGSENGGISIAIHGPSGGVGDSPHGNGGFLASHFTDDSVEIQADGTPMTKKRIFFIKKGTPTLYVLGGEGICDVFRLSMTKNSRLNEWKYLPHLCLPEPLHTVGCTWSLKDSQSIMTAKQKFGSKAKWEENPEKIARVWAVPSQESAKLAPPIEIRLNLNTQTNQDDRDLPAPTVIDYPADARPIPLAAATTNINQALICCGGFLEVTSGTITDEAWLYDMKSELTIDLPRLNVARASHVVAIVDRSTVLQTTWMAFAMGGFNGSRKCNVVERYILGRDCWEVINPMGTARAGFAAVTIDRAIYALGGRAGYGISATCETMHAQTNQWAAVASMNVARAMHSAILFDGNIIVVGGWTGHDWTNSVERYDPNHDKWVQIVSLPVPIGHPMLALGDLPKEECVQDDTFG